MNYDNVKIVSGYLSVFSEAQISLITSVLGSSANEVLDEYRSNPEIKLPAVLAVADVSRVKSPENSQNMIAALTTIMFASLRKKWDTGEYATIFSDAFGIKKEEARDFAERIDLKMNKDISVRKLKKLIEEASAGHNPVLNIFLTDRSFLKDTNVLYEFIKFGEMIREFMLMYSLNYAAIETFTGVDIQSLIAAGDPLADEQLVEQLEKAIVGVPLSEHETGFPVALLASAGAKLVSVVKDIAKDPEKREKVLGAIQRVLHRRQNARTRPQGRVFNQAIPTPEDIEDYSAANISSQGSWAKDFLSN